VELRDDGPGVMVSGDERSGLRAVGEIRLGGDVAVDGDGEIVQRDRSAEAAQGRAVVRAFPGQTGRETLALPVSSARRRSGCCAAPPLPAADAGRRMNPHAEAQAIVAGSTPRIPRVM
jgi:hypothetical protein